MKKKLVLAGAGHAHMLTMARLDSFVEAGFEVNVIGSSEYHYYSGMGPGMLGNVYSPEEIRFASKTVAEKMGATFTQGQVKLIDPVAQRVQLVSGDEHPYDVLSCNLGSQVSRDLTDGSRKDVFPVKPIENLLHARQRILELGHAKNISVGVVGGGVSAVEIAGNVWRLGQEPGMHPIKTTLFAGSRILPHHPDGVRRLVCSSLQKRDIRIEEDCRVQAIETGRVVSVGGRDYEPDIIFVATGVSPSPVFRESGIPTGPDGAMMVNSYLQNPAHPTIFGGGDGVYFAASPLDKVGVYAVRQNPVIYHNLLASLRGKELRSFVPGGRYMQIFNMGNDTGIFYRWPFRFGGRSAFRLKNYIDNQFMKRYQAVE
ncbi:FAD-dependent oxidoreductase [uncultured Desulfuromusa sp.]|uniref:NAD(P)/FAD-dependent oxidoreductase n=1 Tax=uncultured Desulfuromusa sp. TaxID=219183 RepID=UPI002AA7D4A1|nr:FAD-dependent oxidoreductase [uncultured Desulfuromusa sp.]